MENRVDIIDVKQLKFDENNPRFPKEIASGPTTALLEKFIKDERLLEIVDSIGNHDFFHGEPLLIVPIESTRKRFVSSKKNEVQPQNYKVVEGNRRLAALKLLTHELTSPSSRLSIIDSVESAQYRPSAVPCIIFDDEKNVMRYLGFRHITGVKAWGALQKARYAKRLWDEYKSLEVNDGLKKLAKEIGSRSDYVGQILSSLRVYEIAEKENFYGLDLSSNQVEFSVLTTALSYKHITDFLGLDSRIDLTAQRINSNHLKDILDWLFVTPEQAKPVVPDSRDLKKLAAVLSSKEATEELRTKRQLNDAYELSKGPEIALSDSMRIIIRRINSCQSLAVKTPEIKNEHKDLVADLLDFAEVLHLTINKPKRSRK